MAKTRGRPRKFSGPLRPGTTSIKGLNKTEKKQTKAPSTQHVYCWDCTKTSQCVGLQLNSC